MIEIDTTLNDLKQAVIDSVSNFTNEVKLNHILSLLNHDELSNEVDILLEQKNLVTLEVKRGVDNLIAETPGLVSSKLAFLKEVHKKGIINEERLIDNGKLQNLDELVKTKYPSLYNGMKNEIVNWEPQISSSNIGKGELFFFLFGKNIKQCEVGDLDVNGKEIELKAKNSRMLATRGYSTPPVVYKDFFFKELKKKAVNVKHDKNFYNLNKKGIQNLSDVYKEISDVEWCRNHLKYTFKHLYFQSSTRLIDKFVKNVVDKKGGLEVENFVSEFYGFQYDYYKQVANHKGILFLNPKNMNTMYVKNSKTLKDNLHNFTTATSFSWKETRCITYQLTLK